MYVYRNYDNLRLGFLQPAKIRHKTIPLSTLAYLPTPFVSTHARRKPLDTFYHFLTTRTKAQNAVINQNQANQPDFLYPTFSQIELCIQTILHLLYLSNFF